MILSDAQEELKSLGFVNVSINSGEGTVWIDSNWIVTGQSVSAGTKIDKNDEIQINCIKLDVYFNDLFKGKSITDVQNIAKSGKISLVYKNQNNDDITKAINAMTDAEKKELTVDSAQQNVEEKKSAVIYVNIGMEEESASEISVAQDNSNTVFYSTNDSDMVKDDNSGKYAYQVKNVNIYFIVDFDNGCVYYFSGEDWDEKVRLFLER